MDQSPLVNDASSAEVRSSIEIRNAYGDSTGEVTGSARGVVPAGDWIGPGLPEALGVPHPRTTANSAARAKPRTSSRERFMYLLRA